MQITEAIQNYRAELRNRIKNNDRMPLRSSPLANFLGNLAIRDFSQATKQLVGQIFDSHDSQWQSYLKIIQAALINEKSDSQSLVSLANLVLEILSDSHCKLQFSDVFVGKQLDALMNHIQLLLEHGQAKLAKTLFEGLLERKIINPYFQQTANLWVQAATLSMETVEDGLESFVQARDYKINWENVTFAFLDDFCLRLSVLVQEQQSIRQESTQIMLSFLSNPAHAVSYHKTMSLRLLKEMTKQGTEVVSKQFSRLSSILGIMPLHSFIEQQMKKYLKEKRLGSAINLLARCMSMHPLPFSEEKIPQILYEMVEQSKKHPIGLYLHQISKILCCSNMTSFLLIKAEELASKDNLVEVQEWLEFLTSLNISLNADAKKVFLNLVTDFTWNKINDENCKHPDDLFKAVLDKEILVLNEFVTNDPEFIIELANKLKENFLNLQACEYLYSNDFDFATPQRNGLIKLIIRQMIHEEEFVDIVTALSRFEESNGVIASLWKELLEHLFQSAHRSVNHCQEFLAAFKANPKIDVLEEGMLSKTMDLALEREDFDLCFKIIGENWSYHERLSHSFAKKTNQEKAPIWIGLIESLSKMSSPVLVELIKIPQNKHAGGIFSDFNILPVEQGAFFGKLLIGASRVISKDNEEDMLDLLLLRQKMEPIFILFPLFKMRFSCDIAISRLLIDSKNESLFAAGVHLLVDVMAKLSYFSLPPKEWIHYWDKLMINKVKYPKSPKLLPDAIFKEMTPKMPAIQQIVSLKEYSRKKLTGKKINEVLLAIYHRMTQQTIDLKKNAGTLGELWPWISGCELDLTYLYNFAYVTTQAGNHQHLQYFVDTLHAWIDAQSNQPLNEKQIAFLSSSVQFLGENALQLGDIFLFFGIISHPFVKTQLLGTEFDDVREKYLIKIMSVCKELDYKIGKEFIPRGWKECMRHFPDLTQRFSDICDEDPFPSLIDLSLQVLIKHCDLTSYGEFDALQKNFLKIFDSDDGKNLNYKIRLRWIHHLFYQTSETDKGIKNANLALRAALKKLISVAFNGGEGPVKEVTQHVLRFLAREENSFLKIKKSKDSFYSQLLEDVKKTNQKTAYELGYLFNTGKMLESHADETEELVEFYVQAFDIAAKVCNINLIHFMSKKINEIPNISSYFSQLLPALNSVWSLIDAHPLIQYTEDLGIFLSYDLHKKWLSGQSREMILKMEVKHVEKMMYMNRLLIARIDKPGMECQEGVEIVLLQKRLMKNLLKNASKLAGELCGFLKFQIEKNPHTNVLIEYILFFEELYELEKIHKENSTTNYMMDLIRSQKDGKFIFSRDQQAEVMTEWLYSISNPRQVLAKKTSNS